MSSHFIALIPADRTASPSREVLEALAAEHGRIMETDQTRVKQFGERLQFIDSGENFEHIACPACGAHAETDWWGQRMDHAWDTDHGFHMCGFTMPCCGAETQLDQLRYEPAQGFAHWFVSAANAGRGPLAPEELRQLETVAGIPLVQIFQTY